jgi:hypothetical protein
MPAARIEKTVWVASNTPTPDQIAAIQIHCGSCEWERGVFIVRIVVYDYRERSKMQRIASRMQRAVWRTSE